MPTKTKSKAPTVRVTLATFDDSAGRPVYRALREGVKLKEFADITVEDYKPTGMTPLLDATVEFIEHLRKLADKDEVQVGLLLDESGSMGYNTAAVIASVNEFVHGLTTVKKVDRKVAGQGFLVITTDGQENASKTHGYEQVRKLIAKCEKDGWVLIFLGASIDAWGQGAQLGLSGGYTGQMVNTVSTPMGTQAAFASVGADSLDFLGDNDAYVRSRASGSSMRSVSEDGVETTAPPQPMFAGTPVAPPSPPVTPYDAADAVRKATDALAE